MYETTGKMHIIRYGCDCPNSLYDPPTAHIIESLIYLGSKCMSSYVKELHGGFTKQQYGDVSGIHVLHVHTYQLYACIMSITDDTYCRIL